jgi:hypothetical protein
MPSHHPASPSQCWHPPQQACCTLAPPLCSGSLHLTSYRPLCRSRIPCHPLDTVKAKLQVGAQGGLRGVLRHTLRTEGLRGLYRGRCPPHT